MARAKKINFGFRLAKEHNATWVCFKHKKTSRYSGRCPICREDLVCIGYCWRIGRNGKFTKIDNRRVQTWSYIPQAIAKQLDKKRKAR